jgi:hypothetical protein
MSRELDREVAEVVMGWTLKQSMKDFGLDRDLEKWGDESGHSFYIGDDPDSEAKRFHPSSSIAAAWQVVEKMRERGYWLSLEGPDLPEPSWGAYFENGQRNSWHEGYAPTAPEAIARAALAACLDEGNGQG